VDNILLRPLPFPEPERLARVSVVARGPHGEDENPSVDGKTWKYLRDRAHSLDLALHALPKTASLVASGAAQYVQELRVSAGYFRVIGVKPWVGREIDPAEDRPGGPAVVVVSHRLWTGKLGGDPRIVGKKILLRVLASSPDAQPRARPGVSIGYRLVSVQRAMADDRQIPLGRPLLLLWAAVGVVLLIGCINLKTAVSR